MIALLLAMHQPFDIKEPHWAWLLIGVAAAHLLERTIHLIQTFKK